jgi:hypothetical protein
VFKYCQVDKGFGFVTGFIGVLQLVTTSNYNHLINSHNLQFTIARAKSSTFSLGVVTQRLPTMGTPPPSTLPSGGYCLKTTSDSDWSESESRYDRRSVGQSVLVSSPIWGSWPDINYCLTVIILSMSGALLTRGRACHLS